MTGHAPALNMPHRSRAAQSCLSVAQQLRQRSGPCSYMVCQSCHTNHSTQVSDVTLASPAVAKRFWHCRWSRDPAEGRSVVHSSTQQGVVAQQALRQPQPMPFPPAHAQVLLATLYSHGQCMHFCRTQANTQCHHTALAPVFIW